MRRHCAARRRRQHPVGAQHGDDQRRFGRSAVVGRFNHRPPRGVGDAHVLSRPSGWKRSCGNPRRRANGVPRRPTTCRCSTGSGEPADWSEPPADADIRVFDPLVPQLRRVIRRTRAAPASPRSGTRSRRRRRPSGVLDRAEAAAYRADRQGRDHGQDARLRAVVMGRPGDATTFSTSTHARCSTRCSSVWPGLRGASTCRRAPTKCFSSPRALPILRSARTRS